MATKLAKMAADFRTTLATEIAEGGTSATLQSYTDDDGVTLPTGNYFFTLDIEGTKKEHIYCTMTAGVLSNIYSVSRQGVQTSGAARKHRIGASVVMTDYVHLMYLNDLLRGTTDLDSSTPLKYDGAPTFTYGDNELVTWDKAKDYIDGIAIAGSPAATNGSAGISKIATTVETIAETNDDGTYTYVIPVGLTIQDSAGAADEGKIPQLNAGGVLDQTFLAGARTWTGIQSFTADNCQITSDPNSGNDAVRSSYLTAQILAGRQLPFGGSGADGALTVTSGTTNIDLGGAAVFVKNYTTIEISGTGAVTFTNPHANGTVVVFKATGNVTLTSSATRLIDLRGIGASGGAANGNPGSVGTGATSSSCGRGASAEALTMGNGGLPGGKLASIPGSFVYFAGAEAGSGGGGGWGSGNTGGRGGGGLYIECGGALNFTGTIDTSGSDGLAATGGGSNGGGGGGACGLVRIVYTTLTANSGTITATGGAGGNASGGGTLHKAGGGAGSWAGGLGGYGGNDVGTVYAPTAGGTGAGGGGGTTAAGAGGATAGGIVVQKASGQISLY